MNFHFRWYDDYLVLFRKEIGERKNWITLNENRMSSSYSDIEELTGFQEGLKRHKVTRKSLMVDLHLFKSQ